MRVRIIIITIIIIIIIIHEFQRDTSLNKNFRAGHRLYVSRNVTVNVAVAGDVHHHIRSAEQFCLQYTLEFVQ